MKNTPDIRNSGRLRIDQARSHRETHGEETVHRPHAQPQQRGQRQRLDDHRRIHDYGVDTDARVAYVADFAQLGGSYHLPFGTYSSGMRSRLAMGCSMGIDFDTYLVDEVTSVGDAEFREKSHRVFADRMARASAIVVTHSMPMIRRMCTMGAVLDHGRLAVFDDIEEAIAYHEHVMGVADTVGD